MTKSYFIFCIFIAMGSVIDSASFIKPCVWNDKKCILESSKVVLSYLVKGGPETDGLTIDPIYLKEINADNGDLKLHFNDLEIRGVGKTELINVERPDSDKTLLVEFEFPVVITGKYKAGGKIFLIDIEGDGETEIKCDKLRIQLKIIVTKTEKNSKEYYNISHYDYKIDIIEKIFYKFTNLYNGDEEKAKVILDLLDQNGNELFLTIGQSAIKEVVDQEMSRIGKVFLSNPIEKLELQL